jgi:hypothetical protein
MSDAGDAANSLLTSYTEKMSSVAPASVLIQAGLMAAVSLGALVAFSILRPTNSLIYQPKVKYAADEKRPPKIGKGLLDWIQPVWHTKEAEMMDTIGLDAVCYLRFLRMMRNSTSPILFSPNALLISHARSVRCHLHPYLWRPPPYQPRLQPQVRRKRRAILPLGPHDE